jgi:hypothetical protein
VEDSYYSNIPCFNDLIEGLRNNLPPSEAKELVYKSLKKNHLLYDEVKLDDFTNIIKKSFCVDLPDGSNIFSQCIICYALSELFKSYGDDGWLLTLKEVVIFDSCPSVRRNVINSSVNTIGEFGAQVPKPFEKTAEEVLNIFCYGVTDTHPSVRAAACAAFGYCGKKSKDFLDSIRMLYRDPNPIVRKEALAAAKKVCHGDSSYRYKSNAAKGFYCYYIYPRPSADPLELLDAGQKYEQMEIVK